MGGAIWATVKFVAGLTVGTVIGAAAVAYVSGAGDAATPKVSAFAGSARQGGMGLLGEVRGRLDAARAAGDLAAEEIEAAMTQQFRTKVHDPDALIPPNALHS